MKTYSTIPAILVLAIAPITVSCQSNAKADGAKAAELSMDIRDSATAHGYDSEQVKEASEAYDTFTRECREKYGDDEIASEEFQEAFNDAIKADMQKTSH